MGQGGYIICEWDSVAREDPDFQKAFRELDDRMLQKCTAEWHPRTVGYLVPNGDQFGRTTILPALFRGFGQVAATPPVAGTNCLIHWRQHITSAGHQALIMGSGIGSIVPEDFKIAWIGLMFPNKQQQVTEIRWQIGDRKYGRINIEEINSYNKPALIFEEGFIIDEEQSYDLWGYVKEAHDYQRIVMLGAAYYKMIDKVLGLPGAAI